MQKGVGQVVDAEASWWAVGDGDEDASRETVADVEEEEAKRRMVGTE